jgi:4-amino-4-deoxy-L-arabinose transferase-like glycosyltransferase
VPVYLGIFDPKPPLPTFLTALAVLAARVLGADELQAMRVEFLLFALLTVVAIYVLGLWLWRSPLAALVGAVTFASFKGFAVDALGGPDAKTPGVLLSVVALALLVRRRWFWGGLASSLAFLDWQPLGIYMLAAVVAALLVTAADEARWRRGLRAVAGAAIPMAATLLFLAIDGGLLQFAQASFKFPVTGLQRAPETFGSRLQHIADVVAGNYGDTRILFWGGLVLLAVVLAWRFRSERAAAAVVLGTLLGFVALTLTDFQGYPDLYPLLPYAALGIGGAVAVAERRRFVPAVALAATAVLVALSVHWYSPDPGDLPLALERSYAARIKQFFRPGDRLYALGDPTLLVLTGMRNPTRYIYLGSGVAEWAIKHRFKSLAGWKREIQSVDPALIVMNTWHSPRAFRMRAWLKRTYGPVTTVGRWRFWVKPALRARAARAGI